MSIPNAELYPLLPHRLQAQRASLQDELDSANETIDFIRAQLQVSGTGLICVSFAWICEMCGDVNCTFISFCLILMFGFCRRDLFAFFRLTTDILPFSPQHKSERNEELELEMVKALRTIQVSFCCVVHTLRLNIV